MSTLRVAHVRPSITNLVVRYGVASIRESGKRERTRKWSRVGRSSSQPSSSVSAQASAPHNNQLRYLSYRTNTPTVLHLSRSCYILSSFYKSWDQQHRASQAHAREPAQLHSQCAVLPYSSVRSPRTHGNIFAIELPKNVPKLLRISRGLRFFTTIGH
jgi:hypothetical protein